VGEYFSLPNIYVLDIETGALDKSMSEHAALEPWRVRQGNAQIDSVAVIDPDGKLTQIINTGQDSWCEELRNLLKSLQYKNVWAHYAIFDTAWMIATLQPEKTGRVPKEISDITWFDSALLTRWLTNGQKADAIRFSNSLKNVCKTFLRPIGVAQAIGERLDENVKIDVDELDDFLGLKEQKVVAGQDDAYWQRRGLLDVIFTQLLVRYLKPKLPGSQINGFINENACTLPVANSWLIGLRIDEEQLGIIDKEYNSEIDTICEEIGIRRAVLTSPKQMSKLLFEDRGMHITDRTKTGAPSTGKDTLMFLAYRLREESKEEDAAFLERIMRAKTLATLISKYVKTTRTALAHTGDGCIYGAPRLFATYTGRMTYSNATLRKFKTGIALHQIPRKADGVRKMLLPPKGFVLYEADASGQESRLMAIRSKDLTMIKIFQDGLNFHSMTGASIIGKDYFEFEDGRTNEHGHGYFTEQRQLGKLTNLSCNYRIGGKTLARKAYVSYDTYMSIEMGDFLVNTFSRMYCGIPNYWKEVVALSKSNGYTETMGGRRYKLSDWASHRWATESSAINTPIQGSGADMKELALKAMFELVPEAPFLLDLHDATFNIMPEDRVEELSAECDKVLAEIDYNRHWKMELPIDLPYESAHGLNFSDVK